MGLVNSLKVVKIAYFLLVIRNAIMNALKSLLTLREWLNIAIAYSFYTIATERQWLKKLLNA